MLKSITTLFVLGFAAAANAGIVTGDFSGSGNIAVLVSDDWRKASPDDKVGCLNSHGKMIKDDGHEACGVFTKLDDYPYTLSTKEGNCTFEDKSQERNTDSAYGQNSFAFNCNSTYVADVYDSLYTINGFPYIFLCWGDIACFYDAKKAPEGKETLSLWQYIWGSQQMGITPGHVQMQLLWEKIGKPKSKSKGTNGMAMSRVQLTEGMQISLRGKKSI